MATGIMDWDAADADAGTIRRRRPVAGTRLGDVPRDILEAPGPQEEPAARADLAGALAANRAEREGVLSAGRERLDETNRQTAAILGLDQGREGAFQDRRDVPAGAGRGVGAAFPWMTPEDRATVRASPAVDQGALFGADVRHPAHSLTGYAGRNPLTVATGRGAGAALLEARAAAPSTRSEWEPERARHLVARGQEAAALVRNPESPAGSVLPGGFRQVEVPGAGGGPVALAGRGAGGGLMMSGQRAPIPAAVRTLPQPEGGAVQVVTEPGTYVGTGAGPSAIERAAAGERVDPRVLHAARVQETGRNVELGAGAALLAEQKAGIQEAGARGRSAVAAAQQGETAAGLGAFTFDRLKNLQPADQVKALFGMGNDTELRTQINAVLPVLGELAKDADAAGDAETAKYFRALARSYAGGFVGEGQQMIVPTEGALMRITRWLNRNLGFGRAIIGTLPEAGPAVPVGKPRKVYADQPR